jgi:hypothetical protein
VRLGASVGRWAIEPVQKRYADKGENMLSDMTRERVIHVWFAAIALIAVAAMASGAEMKIGTGGTLATLSLVPPLIVFLLWPRAESLTAGDALRGSDRRVSGCWNLCDRTGRDGS